MADLELILTAQEVPLGATVYMLSPGRKEPERVMELPLIIRKLEGGVPTEPRMFILPLDESRKEAIGGKSFKLTDFRKGVHFSPVNVYSPQNAPVDGMYAVFSDGHRMEEEKLGAWLKVTKAGDGNLYVANYFPFEPLGPIGNSWVDYNVGKYQYLPEDKLIGAIEASIQGTTILKNIGWNEKGIQHEKSDLYSMLEQLARRHRKSSSELVAVFAGNALLKQAYPLKQAYLPESAQLVRTDKADLALAIHN